MLRQTLWREKGTRYEVEENDVLEVEGVIENGVMARDERNGRHGVGKKSQFLSNMKSLFNSFATTPF